MSKIRPKGPPENRPPPTQDYPQSPQGKQEVSKGPRLEENIGLWDLFVYIVTFKWVAAFFTTKRPKEDTPGISKTYEDKPMPNETDEVDTELVMYFVRRIRDSLQPDEPVALFQGKDLGITFQSKVEGWQLEVTLKNTQTRSTETLSFTFEGGENRNDLANRILQDSELQKQIDHAIREVGRNEH